MHCPTLKKIAYIATIDSFISYTKSRSIMAEQQFPEPTVGALVFNTDGNIFLMKSHKWNDRYVIPGGHIELGESMEEALKRELKEETGMDIFDIEYICFHEFIYGPGFWKKRHFIFFNFSCKTSATQVRLNDEAQEYVWVNLKDALELDVEVYTRKTIEEYIRRHQK